MIIVIVIIMAKMTFISGGKDSGGWGTGAMDREQEATCRSFGGGKLSRYNVRTAVRAAFSWSHAIMF